MSSKRNHEVTQVLPANWAPTVPAFPVHPRRRYPRDTASLAVTQRLAVVR